MRPAKLVSLVTPAEGMLAAYAFILLSGTRGQGGCSQEARWGSFGDHSRCGPAGWEDRPNLMRSSPSTGVKIVKISRTG
jgi:hypothetical protein